MSHAATILGQGLCPVGTMVRDSPLVLALREPDGVIEPAAFDDAAGAAGEVYVKVSPQLEAVAFLVVSSTHRVSVIGAASRHPI